MSKLIFYTRSFHPGETFGLSGLGYKGDNRGFKTDPNATSRIAHRVEILLSEGKLGQRSTWSSPSGHSMTHLVDQPYTDPDLQPTGQSQGRIDPYRVDGDQHGAVLISYRGQNFAMPFVDKEPFRDIYKAAVPDLDVAASLNFHVDRKTKKLTFSYRMTGDGFPNAESFLWDADQGGRDLFLAVHRRIGSATGQITGKRNIAMATGSAKVDFPDDKFGQELDAYRAIDYAGRSGGPIDLFDSTALGQPATREAWNKVHTAHDAKGSGLRQWYTDFDPGSWVGGHPPNTMP